MNGKKEKYARKIIMKISRSKWIRTVDPYLAHWFNKMYFYCRVGYWPSFVRPNTFNEKISAMKIYKRDRLLAKVADKVEVRGYVREILGDEKAEEILIPLLAVAGSPEEIDFHSIPGDYIVKANHGSGTNIVCTSDAPVSSEILIDICWSWLRTDYGIEKREWCYQAIERRILVEKLLRDECGAIPADYKFHFSNGHCIFLQVDFDRSIDHKRTIIDPYKWEKIPVEFEYPMGPMPKKPKRLLEMLSIARKLAEPLGYARVDLYSVENHIYFGEITNYPGSGMGPFYPREYDRKFGEKIEINNKGKNYFLK
ncbi:ATP-grasp fold amidoligase family protein [Aquisalimonas sp. APHAB1-3]|uniref:ATP-grasp fold amidoligase family protein n=1 Tax=Aquisalimonas sp. APHAB1-3 TaxID=3402080 RepID=UPI003AACCCDF